MRRNVEILHLCLIKMLNIMFGVFLFSMIKSTYLRLGANIILTGETLWLFFLKTGIR